jgi:gluconate 2-dehydrogenase gamma chain
MFFTRPEAALIEAAVVRPIPPDEIGPSALEANVPVYIDRQLHGRGVPGNVFIAAGHGRPR